MGEMFGKIVAEGAKRENVKSYVVCYQGADTGVGLCFHGDEIAILGLVSHLSLKLKQMVVEGVDPNGKDTTSAPVAPVSGDGHG